MGRFYTRKKGSLYIYVTGDGELIEPKDFPEELNIFGAESAWRLNNRMAICKGLQEETLDQVERILKMNGFSSKNLEEQTLEEYFRSGNESLIKEEGFMSRFKERFPTLFKEEEELPEQIIVPKTSLLQGGEGRRSSGQEEEGMIVVSRELVEKIDFNRRDLSREEFIEFCVDFYLKGNDLHHERAVSQQELEDLRRSLRVVSVEVVVRLKTVNKTYEKLCQLMNTLEEQKRVKSPVPASEKGEAETM